MPRVDASRDVTMLTLLHDDPSTRDDSSNWRRQQAGLLGEHRDVDRLPRHEQSVAAASHTGKPRDLLVNTNPLHTHTHQERERERRQNERADSWIHCSARVQPSTVAAAYTSAPIAVIATYRVSLHERVWLGPCTSLVLRASRASFCLEPFGSVKMLRKRSPGPALVPVDPTQTRMIPWK